MRRLPSLETLAVLHAGALLVFVTWAFGGNIAWARTPLSVFGSLGLFITVAALLTRARSITARTRPSSSHANPASVSDLSTLNSQLSTAASVASARPLALATLAALAAYNLLVLASLLHPALRIATIEGAQVLVPRTDFSLWPCTVLPDETLRQLWLFDALFLPCFNLALAVRSRRALRALLFFAGANALILAVLGSLQKLSHASGLFFGAVPSPNKRFFATFIYHNHWGAFIVLTTAACLGLIFHTLRRPSPRGFWQSPAFAGVVAILFLAATVPLAGSRSCTALIAFLVLIGCAHATRVMLKNSPRRSRRSVRARLLPVAGLVAAVLIGGWFAYDLAQASIADRAGDTREQLAAMRAQGGIGGRAALYADTWRMALDQPLFGWGLGSYGRVFWLYNSQQSVDGLPMYFRDAHSDWLQSLAETGFVGTALLGALILVPLLALRRCPPLGELPRFLLFGCGLILLYAWIEFPFGCPAVVFVFWFSLFAALRLAQLEDRPAA